jgi:hypothetical protein
MEHRNKFTRCMLEEAIHKNILYLFPYFIYFIFIQFFLFYKETLAYVFTDVLNSLCVCHQTLILKVQNN